MPRIGWATVEPAGEAFYFAHSYAAETPAATARSEGVVAEAAGGQLPRRPVPPGEARRRRRAIPGAMPLPRLIPCLDVAGGRVVKGVRFEGLRDVGDPVELGERYSEAGADELVYLDVKATLEGRDALVDLVARIADRLSIPFTVGGGVRSVADARGAARGRRGQGVGEHAPRSSGRRFVGELAARLGSQAVVVAIDAADGEVYARAGRRRRPDGPRSSGRARPRRAARARSCSRRSTPTGRATGTTSS